jgi:hypothetical protein
MPRRGTRLTVEQILAWADAHRAQTGNWPRANSGPVIEAPGEKWRAIENALYDGYRGLPGGDSLARLLDRHRRSEEARRFTWTPQEDEWVRTWTAQQVAQQTGRSLRAVYERRRQLGVPAAQPGPIPRGWTAEEDEMVRTLPVREVAQRTGRSLTAVYVRRHQLGVGRR